MTSEIEVIEGEIFKDERGQISSLNNFRFEGVNRFYFIHHPDVKVIRGWHGHQQKGNGSVVSRDHLRWDW